MIDFNTTEKQRTANISYPSSAGSVVSGVYLSAQAVFRLDLAKGETIRPLR